MSELHKAQHWLGITKSIVPGTVYRCLEALPEECIEFKTVPANPRVQKEPAWQWSLVISAPQGSMAFVGSKWVRSSEYTALYDAVATWLDIAESWPDSGVPHPDLVLQGTNASYDWFTFGGIAACT